MASEIRANSITSRAGLSTVTMTDSGPMFSGITTFVDNSGFTFGVGGGTSIFTPATNILTLGTNNTEKVRIDANGNANITGVTTAANFKTGVSNLHDVGLTLSGGQIDVGSNIKIGTAGVVTATSFVGSGANLTGLPAATTINNNANNRVITGSGTANTLEGESNIIVDSSRLLISGNGSGTSPNADDLVIGGIGDSGHRGLTIATSADASIRFADTGDNATGMIEYSQASNFMRFYVEGGEALRIDSNRRVMIGDTSNNDSSEMLLIRGPSGDNATIGIKCNGTTQAGILGFHDTGGTFRGRVQYNHNGDNMVFHTGGAERFRITSTDATLSGATDGVLNITTTDSRGSFIRFQESGTSKVWVGCGQGLSLGAATDLGLRATNDIRMRTGTEMHAVLTQEGYFAAKGMAGNWVSSNTDPASSQFHQFTQTGVGKRIVVFRQEHHAGLGVHIEMTSTGNAESLYCTGNGSTRFSVLNNGDVGSASNSYGGISDIKLKENIVDANSQWNDIKAVKVRNFNFKDTPDTKMLGVVAQEIETVSPSLVYEVVDKDPDTNEALVTTTKQVKYSILHMKAIKALQEAITRIETLEQDNIALRARVTNLEGN